MLKSLPNSINTHSCLFAPEYPVKLLQHMKFFINYEKEYVTVLVVASDRQHRSETCHN